MDVFEILSALDRREEQIEIKLKKIIEANLNPFPMDRIHKAKLLLKLIYEFKKHVEADEFILAGMKLRDLEIEGLKILSLHDPV
ncbi:hypothetical protein ACFOUP_18450 [Belliella kenyensis]|uniref:Hemerythrin HHE cation binding domain-containing protein n=1 Tax=Belliella kenyensis TaxID=1472724 RepID=A0ABV8ET42_9BACT|nr:hypothetical protein [Belliella kenyensis]MCH7402242.1 hypothetical protein [Belliella kenyensis]MDN3601756.1 hypothetical protein [Belliella kenyensis]